LCQQHENETKRNENFAKMTNKKCKSVVYKSRHRINNENRTTTHTHTHIHLYTRNIKATNRYKWTNNTTNWCKHVQDNYSKKNVL